MKYEWIRSEHGFAGALGYALGSGIFPTGKLSVKTRSNPSLHEADGRSEKQWRKKMSRLDVNKLMAEDRELEEGLDVPFRFGLGFDVDYSLNDGVLDTQSDRRIWSLRFSSSGATLDFGHLPAGIYILRIETGVDTFDTHKVVLK